MKTSHVSYGFLLTFLATLFLLRFAPLLAVSAVWMAVIAVIAINLLLLALLTRQYVSLSLGIAMIAGALLAVSCALSTVHTTTMIDVEAHAKSENSVLHGWIVQPPDVRPLVTKYVIAVDAILNADGTETPVKGRVALNDYGGWPEHFYGDEVKIGGRLQRPAKIDDFDYPHYLELQGIRATITRGTIEASTTDKAVPPHARTWGLIGLLTKWRTKVENQVGMILPEPHASLLAGLLTGSRRGLPDDVSDQFRISGITHIVAISGYNITMILALLGSLLFWIPLKWRFWPLAGGVIVFTLFVGASPPVVRAAIMGILGLIALQANRLSVPRLTALWAAFFMLVWSPMMLWYDASFQLSFLALVGIMELTPWLKKLFAKVPNTLAIRDSLITTVAAQIGTLPISMIIFHQLSLVSPFTNLLVAPLVPLAMLLGFVAMCLSALWLPLGLTVSYLAWVLLQFILWIGQFGALVPYAAVRW